TVALWERRERLGGVLSSFALGVNLAVAITVLATVAVDQTSFVHPGAAAASAFERLIARARDAPGGVLADPLDTPVLADRRIVREPLMYRMLYEAGRWDPAPLVRSVCDGEVGLVVLGYPLGS